MYCGKTVRPGAKVTIDRLQEVVYEKSISTKTNDFDLCLEVVLRSCQPLRMITTGKIQDGGGRNCEILFNSLQL